MPTAIRYVIQCEKDGDHVKATYDIAVPVRGSALIASFSLDVDGKELIDQEKWVPGQVRFNGTGFTKIERADETVTAAFSISSNEGWTAADSDVLRGEKRFDDVSFVNH